MQPFCSVVYPPTNYGRITGPLCLLVKSHPLVMQMGSSSNREFKQTTTATATETSPNKGFNEQNNSCARAL